MICSLSVIQLDAVFLKLKVQVVKTSQLLLRPIHAPLGEIGGLDALDLFLNVHHGLEVGHCDGRLIHSDDHVGVILPALQHPEQLGQVGLPLSAGEGQLPVGNAARLRQQAVLGQKIHSLPHRGAVRRPSQHRHNRGGGRFGPKSEKRGDRLQKAALGLWSLAGILRVLFGRLRSFLCRPAVQDGTQLGRGHSMAVHLKLPVGHRGVVRQQAQRRKVVQRIL